MVLLIFALRKVIELRLALVLEAERVEAWSVRDDRVSCSLS
jgi:hypothetical protein